MVKIVGFREGAVEEYDLVKDSLMMNDRMEFVVKARNPFNGREIMINLPTHEGLFLALNAGVLLDKRVRAMTAAAATAQAGS